MAIYPPELRDLKLAANVEYVGDAASLELVGAEGVLAVFELASPFAAHPPVTPGVQRVTLPAPAVGLIAGMVLSARIVPVDPEKAPITCTVGTEGQVDVVLNDLAVVVGQPLAVMSFTITSGNAS